MRKFMNMIIKIFLIIIIPIFLLLGCPQRPVLDSFIPEDEEEEESSTLIIEDRSSTIW